LRITDEWLAGLKARMPELPADKRVRFVNELGLREYDAQVLTASRSLADYFERAAAVSGDPKATANWVTGDLAGALKALGREIEESPVSAPSLGELVALVSKGQLTGKLAKDVLAKMLESGESPLAIVEREGLQAISDTGALEKIVDDVIAANPKQVEQYKSGKTTLVQFFIGQVMKATRGQADPAAAAEIVKRRLE
jgi:aspartyl-tRNA(Asn)/glutamyl-tRNA(Gln) amidotransferase subunit B